MFPNKLHGQVSSVSQVLQLWIILLISSSVYWFIAMNASSILYFCIQIICLNGLIQEVMMSWMAYKWDIGDFDFNFCMMCTKSNFTVSQQTPWKCMSGILLQLILHPKSILSRSLCVQPLGISIDSKERKADPNMLQISSVSYAIILLISSSPCSVLIDHYECFFHTEHVLSNCFPQMVWFKK